MTHANKPQMTYDESQLIVCRCPKRRYFPELKEFRPCNRKIAEALPGSVVRAFCDTCRKYGKQHENSGVDPYTWFDLREAKTPQRTIRYIKVQKVL